MWVLTTDERRALYNLAVFEVVVTLHEDDTGKWLSGRRIETASEP